MTLLNSLQCNKLGYGKTEGMSCLHGVILEEASQDTVLSNEWWASILTTNLQKSLQAGDATNNALDALTMTSFGLLLLAC